MFSIQKNETTGTTSVGNNNTSINDLTTGKFYW